MLEELRSDSVSTVFHELRTPLAAVYGAVLTRQPGGHRSWRGQRADPLAVIAADRRLARTVNDILSATARCRPAATRPGQLRRRGPDPNLVDAAQVELPESLELSLDLEPGLPAVAGDPDKVREVPTNLVDNAVSTRPTEGASRSRVKRCDDAARFSVVDHGLGIRSPSSGGSSTSRPGRPTSRGVGGTGLGLYICRELVRGMNQKFWSRSAPARARL